MSDAQRLSIRDVDPDAYLAVGHLSRYVRSSGLSEELRALVDILASQLNRCAWCLDMHVAEARAAGVEQRQLDVVAAWKEAGDLFSPRERAALALTEAVTLISTEGVPDEVWEAVAAVFDEKETVHLLMAIATINVYNRMNVAVRTALGPEPYVVS